MKGILIQLTAAVFLSTVHFLASYSLTWISYNGPLLESDTSPIKVKATKHQMNMISSILILGCISSCLTTGQLPELVGRKKSEMIGGIVCALAWSLIITAKSITQLVIARYIFGFGVGVHFIAVMTYINEISQPHIRGTTASIPLFMFSLGCLVSYITGWVCSYDFVNYLNLSLCVLFVVILNFLKESPVYLIAKNRDKEALASLKFYRGASKTTPAILEEFDNLKKQQDSLFYKEISKDEVLENIDAKEEKEAQTIPKQISAWRTLVTSKATQRAIIILTTYTVLSAFMGTMAIQVYAGHFFKTAAPEMSPHLCSVILAVSIVAGNSLAILGTDLVGRRILMVSTCAICTVCLGVLVSLLRWSWAPEWAVPLVMLLFSCAFQAGVNNVPMVQMSESFMPEMKGLATSIITSVAGMSNFILLSTFGILVETLGLYGTFLMFSIIAAVTTVLTFLTAKETKGIPLADIQSMYERGYFYWK